MRLRTGKTDVVVVPGVVDDRESLSIPVPGQTENPPPRYEYLFDPTRPQSVLAHNAVDDQLQRAAGRKDVAEVEIRWRSTSPADGTSIFWCPVCWA